MKSMAESRSAPMKVPGVKRRSAAILGMSPRPCPLSESPRSCPPLEACARASPPPGISPRLMRKIKSFTFCIQRESGVSPRGSLSAPDEPRSRSMSSPGNMVLRKISASSGGSGSTVRVRPLRVLLMGQGGVGKTAFAVRFLTKRFIGEYASTLEKLYPPCYMDVDGETAAVEIFDTASQEESSQRLPEQIKWADAFILLYSIADKCSFDEVSRLKLLISFHKRSIGRKSNSGRPYDIPIALVANKKDAEHERMINDIQGHRLAQGLGCSSFYELSVRDSYSAVHGVLTDLYRDWRGLRPGSSALLDSPLVARRGRLVEESSSSDDDRRSISTINSEDRGSSLTRKISRVFRRGATTRQHADSFVAPPARCDVSSRCDVRVNDGL